MQQFFIDNGLWLLIALLIVIGVVFLLSGRRKAADVTPAETVAPIETMAPVETVAVERQAAPVAPVAAAPVAPAPVAVPAPAPVAAPVAEPIPVSPAVTTPAEAGDDLLKLKGVGPKLNLLLIELGVTRYAQIAQWSDADIAAIDARLGNFKGRPVRDQWVDQARYLAAGDTAGFEAKYGKI
ncbi:MAG TPA: hypothetical protein VJQ78_10560 [Sphingobium sp.]|nr:hypothetical protein [Sphingobium sp.]